MNKKSKILIVGGVAIAGLYLAYKKGLFDSFLGAKGGSSNGGGAKSYTATQVVTQANNETDRTPIVAFDSNGGVVAEGGVVTTSGSLPSGWSTTEVQIPDFSPANPNSVSVGGIGLGAY
jgi:hypothetical protein